MSWQFFIAISILCDGLGRIVQRAIMKGEKSDPIANAVASQIISGVIILFYAIITGFEFPTDLSAILPNLVLVPFLWGTSSILVFRSLKTTEASVFTILFSTRVVWIILLALFLLDETFSLPKLLGTILILLSIIFLTGKSKKLSIGKGEVFALIAAVGFGAGIVNDSYIVKSFDVESYLGLNFLSSAVFMWFFNRNSSGEIKRIFNSGLAKNVTLLGIIYAVSTVTYFLAYKLSNNASQIGAIYPVSAIITVILAIFLLREKKNLLRKVIAVGVSFIGVLLVS